VRLCAGSKEGELREIGGSPGLDVSSDGKLSKLRTASNGDRTGCGSVYGEDGILVGSAGRSLKSNVDSDRGRTDSGSEYREDGLLMGSVGRSFKSSAVGERAWIPSGEGRLLRESAPTARRLGAGSDGS